MYKFFFDESFHDKKIVIGKKKLNTFSDNLSDSYVGFFWGAKEDVADEIISGYKKIEEKYKNLLGVEKEFKATTFALKNFKVGVKSFNKHCFNFYTEFFQLLDRKDIIIQYNILSKIELLLKEILCLDYRVNKQYIEMYHISVEAFLYSLAKFIRTYYNEELIAALYSVKDAQSSEYFITILIEQLENVVKATQGIVRKGREITAFNQMITILSLLEVDVMPQKEVLFSYTPNFNGLMLLLKERRIKPSLVSLCIDEEEKTVSTAKQYSFKDIIPVKSDMDIGVRIADILSNFVGRFIYCIHNDKNMQEDKITSIDKIADNDLSTKRLLSDDWFDINDEQFKLYYRISKVLAINHTNYYWTVLTGTFFDDALLVLELVKFFYYCGDYTKFQSYPLALRKEYFNSQVCDELGKRFQAMVKRN